MNIAIQIGFMILLVACSAFFSGSEIAFATANKLRLQKTAEDGSKLAKSAQHISNNFTKFLSTVLVGNNLVNIAFSSCCTVLAIALFGSHGQAVAATGATVILLIFGEIFPKIIGSSCADKVVLYATPLLRFFMVLFTPVVSAVSFLVSKISPLWTPEETEPAITDEDLVSMVDTIEEEGIFTEDEGELIRSAIEFSDLNARDILIPRVDLAAYDIDDDISVLLLDRDSLSFSRIPVYKENIDNIIGILSTKKLVKAVLAGEKINIEDIMTPPMFVHMTRSISSILTEFRRTRSQMAVVVDEFGGTMGILTLEDILEEIVGDIYDESDEVEQKIEQRGENSYIVEGGLNTLDMFDLIDYEPFDFDSEYTTVGGWAAEMLDRFPEQGDSFKFEKLTVTVLSAEAMRVEKLLVMVDREEDDG